MLPPRLLIKFFTKLFGGLVAVLIMTACAAQPPINDTATIAKIDTIAEKIDNITTDGGAGNITSNAAEDVTSSAAEDVTSSAAEDVTSRAAGDITSGGASTPHKMLDPVQLYGLDKIALIARLGAVDYLKVDGGVEIYQYRLATCVIDFVLSGGRVTSWHGRHRVYGKRYDDMSCRIDLAKLDQF